MKEFLENIKTFVGEIIGLIGGLYWGYKSDWDYEPVILVLISLTGILIFFLMKFSTSNNFEVKLFSEEGQGFLEPKFEKIIKKSKLVDLSHDDIAKRITALKNIQSHQSKLSGIPFNDFFSKVNHSWVELEVEMTNTGSTVIEDWKVNFSFEDGIKKLSDRSTQSMIISIPDLSPMSRIAIIEPDEMAVYYRPYENRPLIQKDIKTFKVPILIDPNATEVSVSWEILARNYSISGNAKILVKPSYEEKVEFEEVYDESDLVEDEVYVTNLIKDK
ncbi:hypothetical protein D3C87_181690 [compost metagenome]